jgi:hypothetical protein
MPQVGLAESDEMVQCFLTQGFHPAFGVGVHVRHVRPYRFHFDALACEDPVEFLAEFAVMIAEQNGRFLRQFRQSCRELACLLGYPGLTGLGAHTRQKDAGADMNEEQDEAFNQATASHDLLAEEVTRQKRGGVALDELDGPPDGGRV